MDVIDNEGVACVAQPRCVGCGSPGRRIHEGMRDVLFGAPGTWNTLRCLKPDCGLAWLDPQPLPSERQRLSAGYRAHAAAEQVALEAAESRREPARDKYVSKGLVAFAKQHNQQVRGHTLLWHNQLPDWLTTGVSSGTISNDQLKALLHKHITDEVSHFKGKIWQWDVANEVFANAWDPHPLTDGINGDDFWVSHLGEGIIAEAFRGTRETNTFIVENPGRLYVASYFPGEWSTREGDLATPDEAYAAFALARETATPIIVFSIATPGSIAAILSGANHGTIVAG